MQNLHTWTQCTTKRELKTVWVKINLSYFTRNAYFRFHNWSLNLVLVQGRCSAGSHPCHAGRPHGCNGSCSALFCGALQCTALHAQLITTLHCTELHSTALPCSALLQILSLCAVRTEHGTQGLGVERWCQYAPRLPPIGSQGWAAEEPGTGTVARLVSKPSPEYSTCGVVRTRHTSETVLATNSPFCR